MTALSRRYFIRASGFITPLLAQAEIGYRKTAKRTLLRGFPFSPKSIIASFPRLSGELSPQEAVLRRLSRYSGTGVFQSRERALHEIPYALVPTEPGSMERNRL